MKMMYNGTEIKSLKVKHYEMSSNFATVEPSDIQAGKTAVARGKKITGTGKAFEFANYGYLETNTDRYVPSTINVIELASTIYPIKLNIDLNSLNTLSFDTEQNIATVTINNVDYDLKVSVKSNILKITCDQTFGLQIFYGKDNYV